MIINYKLIEVIGVITGLFTIASYLWKVTKFLGSKSKSVDSRIQTLYEVSKIQQLRISDVTDYLSLPIATRGEFRTRKSLNKLEESAFGDYEDEHTGFN